MKQFCVPSHEIAYIIYYRANDIAFASNAFIT